MTRKVLVVAEIKDNGLRNVSFEAIAAGKTIAEGGEIVGVLIGDSVQNFANELIYYGADRVVTVEDEKLSYYSSDGFSQALLAVIDESHRKPLCWGIQRPEKIYHLKWPVS